MNSLFKLPSRVDHDSPSQNLSESALLSLGLMLREEGYYFTAVSPDTHARVLARPARAAIRTSRDVFGWNRPFNRDAVKPQIFDLLRAAGVASQKDDQHRSTVRFATCGPLLLLHSGYPTLSEEAVFLGPDTYRFLRLLDDLRFKSPPTRIADIGTGSGAAAIALGKKFRGSEIIAADINRKALRFTSINSVLNGQPHIKAVESDLLANVDGDFDLIVANPPYMLDPDKRAYRHGGGLTGAGLSLRILKEGCARLRPGGRLVLYTGVAMFSAHDEFKAAAQLILDGTPWCIERYAEIDPDVFGSELDNPAYADAERIAVVAVTVSWHQDCLGGVGNEL